MAKDASERDNRKVFSLHQNYKLVPFMGEIKRLRPLVSVFYFQKKFFGCQSAQQEKQGQFCTKKKKNHANPFRCCWPDSQEYNNGSGLNDNRVSLSSHGEKEIQFSLWESSLFCV